MTKNIMFGLYILASLYIIPMAGFSQDTKTVPDAKLFQVWNVAVVGAQVDSLEGLSANMRRVALGVAPLIQTFIKEASKRFLSTEEQYKARKTLRKTALFALEKKLEEKYKNIDTQSLATENSDIWKKRKDAKKEIKALKDRIKKIQNIDSKNIPVESSLPIHLVEQTTVLSITPSTDLQAVASTLNAQELFYYTLESVGQYVAVTIFSYDILSRESSRVLYTITESTNIAQMFSSFSKNIRSAIIGTPAASLKLAVQTSSGIVLQDAKIFLDGDLVGYGKTFLSTVVAGVHTITVFYNDEQRNLVLSIDKNEAVSRTILFDINTKDTITVMSKPMDAKVYINSEWVGNTPVIIPRMLSVRQMEIVKAGYERRRITLNHLIPNVVNLTLNATHEIPLKERLKKDRKDFYTAFAVFGISLAAPMILNGFYVNENLSISLGGNRLSAAGRTAAIQRRDILFYSYIGSAVVSVGLSVYAFIELWQYLRTASEYHER